MDGPMQLPPTGSCYMLHLKGWWHSLPPWCHTRVLWTCAVKSLDLASAQGIRICEELQVFPITLYVTAKRPQARSILTSFPSFPFHIKFWYLTRWFCSKEKESDFEPVAIHGLRWRSRPLHWQSSPFISVGFLHCTCDDLWCWHHCEAPAV